MNKRKQYLESTTLTTDIVWDRWFIPLSTRVDLCFEVQNMQAFSWNTGKVHFEGLVNFLRYIVDTKNLGFIYYAKIEFTDLSDILIQSIIKNNNQLLVFFDYNWQDCSDTDSITGEYILFYQGGQIDHWTHVSGPVSQYRYESEYNEAFTA